MPSKFLTGFAWGTAFGATVASIAHGLLHWLVR